MKPIVTIVKIKNPVLRGLAGFTMFSVGLAALIGVLYALGLVVGLIDPTWLDYGFGMTVLAGVMAVCLTVLALAAGCGIYFGARALGEKFFDP